MKSFTEDENKVLEIDVKGPAVVTAGDIKHDSDIQVLNPDLYICTVAEGYHFHVRMNAKNGRGYVRSDYNKSDNMPIGVIQLILFILRLVK